MKKTTPAKKPTAAAASKPSAKAAKRPAAKKKPAAKKTKVDAKPEGWMLRLYVAGQTPKSLTAFVNLKKLCEEHLSGIYQIEVVDLAKQPHLAAADQIVALPTLVRRLPPPIKRVVGDLSNHERVVIGMELLTRAATA